MPRGGVPTNRPFTRKIAYAAEVMRSWGDEWGRKDTAYIMRNGRTFEVSEPQGGPYTGTSTGS